MANRAALAVAPRFTRAVHIRRDFRDLRYRLDGYQVTPLVRQAAARIGAGLAPGSAEPAFSVVGPFGSGKSAFGLFVAHFLQRAAPARRQLLASLKADAGPLPLDAPPLLAVLVPGNNSSLRRAVLIALGEAIAGQRLRTPALGALRHALDAAAADPLLDPARAGRRPAAARRAHDGGHDRGAGALVGPAGEPGPGGLRPRRRPGRRSGGRRAARAPEPAHARLPPAPRQLHHLGGQRPRPGRAGPGCPRRAWGAGAASRPP